MLQLQKHTTGERGDKFLPLRLRRARREWTWLFASHFFFLAGPQNSEFLLGNMWAKSNMEFRLSRTFFEAPLDEPMSNAACTCSRDPDSCKFLLEIRDFFTHSNDEQAEKWQIIYELKSKIHAPFEHTRVIGFHFDNFSLFNFWLTTKASPHRHDDHF